MTIIFLLLSALAGLMVLIKTISLIVFAVRAEEEKRILMQRGVKTRGKILVHKYVYKKLAFIMMFTGDMRYADTVDHVVSAEFEVNGETVYKETPNYRSLGDCTVGRTVDIVYDADNPDRFSIDGGRQMSSRIIPQIIKILLLAAGQIILTVLAIIF